MTKSGKKLLQWYGQKTREFKELCKKYDSIPQRGFTEKEKNEIKRIIQKANMPDVVSPCDGCGMNPCQHCR